VELPFNDLLSAVRARPQMFGLDGSYDAYVAFLTGLDLGNAGGVLRGFKEWLTVRTGRPSSLAWTALVRRIALGVGANENLPRTLGPDQEREAVDGLFRLLDEFRRECQSSPSELARMYSRYTAL
jgi:hypothetical protein